MKEQSMENWGKFQPLEMDDSSQLFLDTCLANSDNTLWQIWLTAASSILSWFIAATSINGWVSQIDTVLLDYWLYSPNVFATLHFIMTHHKGFEK